MQRLWVLGAPSPEMEAIECLLLDAGECVVYATREGYHVHQDNSRMADAPRDDAEIIYAVDCGWFRGTNLVHIDHQYDLPIHEFLSATLIGQVYAILYVSHPGAEPGRYFYRDGAPGWWEITGKAARYSADHLTEVVPEQVIQSAAKAYCDHVESELPLGVQYVVDELAARDLARCDA